MWFCDVNDDMGYSQSVISMQCFSIVSLTLLWRVMVMSIFQNKKYNVMISNHLQQVMPQNHFKIQLFRSSLAMSVLQ